MSDTSIELSGPSSIAPMSIDMEKIYVAEGRIHDIAFVNRETAGELLAVLGEGYSELSQAFGKVHHFVGMVEIAKKKRKAVLTLDIIPQEAKARGLSNARSPTGSEDVREAFYFSDEQYLEIAECLAAAEATKELLSIKLRSLWTAIDSVKAIIRTGQSSPHQNHEEKPHDIEAPMAPSEPVRVMGTKPRIIVDDDEVVKTPSTRFGKPKH